MIQSDSSVLYCKNIKLV